MAGNDTESFFLPCWLEAPGSPERLREAVAELVPPTAAVGEAFAEHATQASRMSPEIAFGLGLALLHEDGGSYAELGRCWLWVAASLGHEKAAAELARELADEGAREQPRLDAPVLMALVSHWLRRPAAAQARPVRGRTAIEEDEIDPEALKAMVEARTAGDEEADDGADGDASEGGAFARAARARMAAREIFAKGEVYEAPGVVVVPQIGDAASREGRELTRRYAHLIGRKLPFKGRLPEPGETARRFLATFPWAGQLARYLEGQFAILRASGNEFPRLPPLLLVGPSGAGKTRMLEWLADACEFPSMTVPIGGTNDSAGLAAVARGWITAQVSAPVALMAETQCCNPALILDEVDKGVSDISNRNGSVMGALLAILQPPAEGYRDSCLMANVDISNITFLASANSLAPLTDTFRKRFIVQPVPAPQPEHFDAILPGVIENEARRLGVRKEMLPWLSSDDRAWLKSAFVASRCSIRQLEQAYRVLSGDRAAEEAAAMQRPN